MVAHGLDSPLARDSVEHHDKLLTWIEDAVKGGPYSAGEAYSLADVAVIPYVLRLELLRLAGIWDGRPGVVGESPLPAVDGGGDLQAHDRNGLGTVQEPPVRAVGQGAGVACRGVTFKQPGVADSARWATMTLIRSA